MCKKNEKNIKSIIMKKLIKLIIIFLLGIIMITSCDFYGTPILNSNKPFVVVKIVKTNNNFSKYYSPSSDAFIFYNVIELPSKMYNIGDTITIMGK